MTSKEKNPAAEDPKTPVEKPVHRRPEQFHHYMLEQFRNSLEQETDQIYDQWGYSMLYCLGDEEAARQLKQIGFEATDAVDFYNQGCLLAQEKQFEAARDAFAKAGDMDPNLSEALYNLALVHEKLGDIVTARQYWQTYMDQNPNDETCSKIEAHLVELPAG